jgi:hypothetical protein
LLTIDGIDYLFKNNERFNIVSVALFYPCIHRIAPRGTGRDSQSYISHSSYIFHISLRFFLPIFYSILYPMFFLLPW